MRNYLLLVIVLLPFLALAQADFPTPQSPPRMVNDYTGTLDSRQIELLEYKLRTYRDTTSNEIAIVIVANIAGYEVAQYASELGERWGIGKKQKNNGVLILVAKDDRKVNISTGYGLEPVITDAHSKRIIQNYIVPNFRNNDYFTGLDQASSVLMALASGEFKADPKQSPSAGAPFLLFILLIILIIIISARNTRNKHYSSKPLDPLTTLIMMGGLSGRNGRSYSDFSGGKGVFGGGGGSSFGGFGGGSFGGGGASGSW